MLTNQNQFRVCRDLLKQTKRPALRLVRMRGFINYFLCRKNSCVKWSKNGPGYYYLNLPIKPVDQPGIRQR